MTRKSGRQWATIGRRLVVGTMALAMMRAPGVHAHGSVTLAPSADPTPAPEKEAPSASAATGPARVPMFLVVRVELGESDAEVAPVVRQRVRERLHGLGLIETRGAARELMVKVRWADADAGASESYVVDYEFATMAELKPRVLGSEVCERCGMGELLAMLDRDIAKLRPELVAPVEVPAPTVAATPVRDSLEPPPKRRAAPLSTLGKVGIGVSAAGALGVIAGGILLGTPDKSRVDPNNPQRLEIKRYGESGAAFLGVGLGVLVAGVVMLAVDRARARRRR
jgi:hypothetical protein